MFFLFATSTSYVGCSFGGVDANNWVQINALLLVIAISLGGVFYAFSNILPPSQSEKMKGMVKAEIFQGIIGIVIVSILLTSAVAWCNIGSSLTGSAGLGTSNPMSFSESYLQNLLFTKGFSLFGSLYSESALLMIDGILVSHIATFLQRIEESFLPVQLTLSQGIANTLETYSLSFGGTFFTIFSIVSGIVFVIYLTLPVVSSIALTVVVPTAIAMRMIPFFGPKVREVSDAFLSIAIAAYFIFPLMIVMNSLLVSYLYTPCGTSLSACNPYSSYLGSYSLQSLPVNSFFNTPATSLGGGFSLPENFFAGIISGNGGILGTLEALFNNIAFFPQVLASFSQNVALFIFQGVFLIGLDILVTVAFAQALTRGLNSVSTYVSGGGFWG
jgi:hypothetical protein